MKNKKAFTLIEVMVVMAIIAVLAVLIIGAIQLARRTSTETTHRSNAKTVQTALERVYAKDKSYCGISVTCAAPTLAAMEITTPLTNTNCDAAVAPACGVAFLGDGVCVQALTAQSYSITVYNHACGGLIDTYTLN